MARKRNDTERRYVVSFTVVVDDDEKGSPEMVADLIARIVEDGEIQGGSEARRYGLLRSFGFDAEALDEPIDIFEPTKARMAMLAEITTDGGPKGARQHAMCNAMVNVGILKHDAQRPGKYRVTPAGENWRAQHGTRKRS